MPNADRPILVAATAATAVAAAALAGCSQQQQPPEQNIVFDNEIDANAVIETLPPDESSTTPSNQLVNGADNPDVNDFDGSSNTY
jgi:hypothetical protein